MCGISGIVNFNGDSVKEEQLRCMMEIIRHRGPNDDGTYIEDNIGLGFVRLSIIDLSSAGHQPKHDGTGRYTLVFNGEIFNYLELRDELTQQGISFTSNSDSEVLLKSYIHYGEKCLDKFNGMFAFVIYDNVEKTMFGARDRFGVKPFYYHKSEKNFIFASEIPAILSVYGRKNTANEEVIFDYLAFNRTDQTENTFFNDIKKLQHGHCFTLKNGELSIRKWYDLKEKVCKTEIKSDVEKYKDLLEDAVRIRLRSDVPVGVCLSGGLDSSTITSIISKEFGNTDVHTFSAVYGSGIKADESKFINLYQDLLKNMHQTYPSAETLMSDLNDFVRLHGEPMPSTGPYAQYRVMKLAKENVTVTLDGQGADEELAGYHYFYGLYFKELLKSLHLFRMFKEMFCYLKLHRSGYGFMTMIYFMLPRGMKRKARVNERGYISECFAAQHNRSVIVDELYNSRSLKESLVNHFEYKLEHLLKWNDRNSMAFSIESRTPFLDYRLVEYTLQTESAAKINNGYTKFILREAMKNILPEPIRKRRDKIGFGTPEDDWFRTPEFQTLIYGILNSKSCRERGIINCDAALSLYEKHCKKELNISKDIWKWINLELWYREYICE